MTRERLVRRPWRGAAAIDEEDGNRCQEEDERLGADRAKRVREVIVREELRREHREETRKQERVYRKLSAAVFAEASSEKAGASVPIEKRRPVRKNVPTSGSSTG